MKVFWILIMILSYEKDASIADETEIFSVLK